METELRTRTIVVANEEEVVITTGELMRAIQKLKGKKAGWGGIRREVNKNVENVIKEELVRIVNAILKVGFSQTYGK